MHVYVEDGLAGGGIDIYTNVVSVGIKVFVYLGLNLQHQGLHCCSFFLGEIKVVGNVPFWDYECVPFGYREGVSYGYT